MTGLKPSVSVAWVSQTVSEWKVRLTCGHVQRLPRNNGTMPQPGDSRQCDECPEIDPVAMFDDVRGRLS